MTANTILLALVILMFFAFTKKIIDYLKRLECVLDKILQWVTENMLLWSKEKIFLWRIGVAAYIIWIIWSFWKVILFPATPITTNIIVGIVFHPPFIQLILIVTLVWFVVALWNIPKMRLKGINTPLLKLELSNSEEVARQAETDLEASRESDEIRWLAVRWASTVNPLEDVDNKSGGASDIELIAIATGGILLDSFRKLSKDVEFMSGIIELDEIGGLPDDILYFSPDAQYVIRNAWRENQFQSKNRSLAVPVQYKGQKAIFYLSNSYIKIYKMDCLMVETIWSILLNNIIKEQ